MTHVGWFTWRLIIRHSRKLVYLEIDHLQLKEVVYSATDDLRLVEASYPGTD